LAWSHLRELLVQKFDNPVCCYGINRSTTAIAPHQLMLLFVDQIRMMEQQDGRTPIPAI